MNHCLLLAINTRTTSARVSGVHRIASHLRSQNWDAEVIDYAFFWTFEELVELAKSRITSDTKFVGFSHLWQIEPAETWPDHIEKFCEWIKKTYPNIKLITGSQQKPIFASSHIDYSVSGYGEYALDAILNYEFSNGPRPQFDLVKGKGGQKIISSLHTYPAYPMREPTIIYEDRDFFIPGEWASIEFSRGCKFSCSFCSFPILGVKGDYTRSAEGFRTQLLDAYDRFGIENYTVTDDTFNDSTGKITKFADVVDTLPWKPYFSGFLRADLMISRPPEKEELLRMGFLGQFYGVETFNPAAGKLIGKGMHPDKMKQGLLDAKKYFSENSDNLYRGTLSFIYGLPLETVDSLKETVEWTRQNWQDQAIASWALEITDDEYCSQSSISLDYKKYGYEKMPEIELAQNKTNFSVPKKHPRLINWKSEYMNFETAIQLAVDGQYGFNKMANFRLSELYMKDSKVLSVRERLKLSYADSRKLMSLSHIKTYIEKKLSL